MTTFDAGPVMAGLTGFQRRSVEHVVDRFHGADPGRRFLVADETGLGKSLVARGVIARTIETLQHERGRKQINVVYVCSNTDLATQNLARLDVTGGKHRAIPSRLSLLAKYSRELQPDLEVDGVAVNLVSFTPGTSFSTGHRSGQVQERALLFLLLSTVVDLTGWNAAPPSSCSVALSDRRRRSSSASPSSRPSWTGPLTPTSATSSSGRVSSRTSSRRSSRCW